MDEIKLARWRQQFNEKLSILLKEHNVSIPSQYLIEDAYKLELDEAAEWKLIFTGDTPPEMKKDVGGHPANVETRR